MNFKREELESFFNRVGENPIRIILPDIKIFVSYMKEYPEIAVSGIKRFRCYFKNGSTINYIPTLSCLIEIAKEIPQTRSVILESMGDILFDLASVCEGSSEGSSPAKLLQICDLPLNVNDNLHWSIARSVVTLTRPMILIVGAGFSYDTMPITNELQPIMVQALKEMNIASPMKMIRENEKKAWEIIKSSPEGFKHMFYGRCSNAKPSIQHKIISEMFHNGNFSHIISFNWDDLLEKAYLKEFGTNIPKLTSDDICQDTPCLWKLHGDVEDLKDDWIFPFDKGRVFRGLLESLEKTSKTLEYALIVGYSENELTVQKELIYWLDSNVLKVKRIRPNWDISNEGGIAESANKFFERLSVYMKIIEKQ